MSGQIEECRVVDGQLGARFESIRHDRRAELGCLFELAERLDATKSVNGRYRSEDKVNINSNLEAHWTHTVTVNRGHDVPMTFGQVEQSATEKEQMAQSFEELQAALDEYKKRAAQPEKSRLATNSCRPS